MNVVSRIVTGAICATVALGLAKPADVHAQAKKPAAVVSIASVDALKSRMAYLAEAAGMPGAEKQFLNEAAAVLAMMDSTKPAGGVIYVQPSGEFEVLGFAPVKDLPGLMGLLNSLGVTAKEVDGVWEMPQLFIKQQGNWAFFSNTKASLTALPQDPVSLLGGLEKKYDIGITASPASLPAAYREMAKQQIKSDAAKDLAKDQPAIAKQLMESMLTQILDVVDGTKELTAGLKIDKQQRSIYLEGEIAAVPGSNLAKTMGTMKSSPSNFGGFILPDAGLSGNYNLMLPPTQIAEMKKLLGEGRSTALALVDGEQIKDASKARVKEIINGVLDVLDKTVDEGKLDVVMSGQFAAGQSNMVLAAGVADGPKLDEALQKLLALVNDDPDVPAAKVTTEKHGATTIHHMTLPLPAQGPADFQKMFGPTVKVAIATGPKAVYVAGGSDCVAVLKKAIDNSSQPKPMPTVQVTYAVSQLMTAFGQLNPNPAVASVGEGVQGYDRVMYLIEPIENGGRFRLEMQDGIVRMIGNAVKGFLPGAGGAGGGF